MLLSDMPPAWLQVKRRLDWETGPVTGTANIVSTSNGTRVISIRSVSAAPFGQKLPSGQTTTTVISIPPSLRSADQLPLAGSGTGTSAGSNNSNKLLRCGSSNDRTRTQVIQSSTVSITPVNVRDDHLFKTPIKPAPASAVLLTPATRKRKVSGSSSNSSASPRSSPASDSCRSLPTSLSHHSARAAARHSSFPAFDSPSGKSKHRYETSLGQLTKKFITLLREAPSGVRKLLALIPPSHFFLLFVGFDRC